MNQRLGRPLVRLILWLGASCAGVSSLAHAQLAGDWDFMRSFRPREYQCLRVNNAPKVDGKLDDDAWKNAPWTEPFVDIEGPVRPNPRQTTRAKLVWDSQGLYIGAELNETHLVGTLTEHDCVIFQDNDFEVFIDPDGDHHQYLELELNALNTTWDLYLPKPYKDSGTADNSWEFEGMKTAVHLDGTINDPSDQDRGWTVEIFLPWSSLQMHSSKKLPPGPGGLMRLSFSRVEWQWQVVDGKYKKVEGTKEDNWIWTAQGIIDMHRPERWGYVVFVDPEKPSTEPRISNLVAIENRLMEVYHRQRAFHAKQGRFAQNLDELQIEPALLATLAGVELKLTPEGYLAQLVDAPGTQRATRWLVRQDSKMWSEPVN